MTRLQVPHIRLCLYISITYHWLAVWHSGSIVRGMNEVDLRWAQLVLGWVTIFERVYHLSM